MKLRSVDDLRWAAGEIYGRFGCAALVKGGHLRSERQAVDVFFDGREELILNAPFIWRVVTHGTGCTYSAAIAAYLARGLELVESVQRAKRFITRAIRGSRRIGRHWVLDTFGQATSRVL